MSTSDSTSIARNVSSSTIGDACRVVVDPVRVNVVGTVARCDRVAHLPLVARAAGLVVGKRMHGHVLQPVVEVMRERSREDVRVLRHVRDAAARNRLVHVGEIDAGDIQAAGRGQIEPRDQLREFLLAAVAGTDQRDLLAARNAERQPLDAGS